MKMTLWLLLLCAHLSQEVSLTLQQDDDTTKLLRGLPCARYKVYYVGNGTDHEAAYEDESKEERLKRVTYHHKLNTCDCKIKNQLVDLGRLHFPRYLLNSTCDSEGHHSKCPIGAKCKPIQYQVNVLKIRRKKDRMDKDELLHLVPEVLRSYWKIKIVAVNAGCFCSYH